MFKISKTDFSLSFCTAPFFPRHQLFSPDSLQPAMSPRKQSGRYFSSLNGPDQPNPFKRSTVPASHRGKKKFYAIRVGLNGFRGVVTTWEECALYVTGVKGAVFKSFKTYEQASNYLEASPDTQVTDNSRSSAADVIVSGSVPSATALAHPPERNIPEEVSVNLIEDTLNPKYDPRAHEPSKLIVYTDGACTNNGKANAKAGVGVYFGDDSPYNISCRLLGTATNQRAEITAVLKAMQIVVDHGLIARGGVLEIHTDSKVSDCLC